MLTTTPGVTSAGPQQLRLRQTSSAMAGTLEALERKDPIHQIGRAVDHILSGESTQEQTRAFFEHYKELGEVPPMHAFDGPFRFRFGGASLSGFEWPKIFYTKTNETYQQELISRLRNVRGIRNYVGILGGGDQHVPILAALQEHNPLERGVLVDRSLAQTVHGIFTMCAYNRIRGHDVAKEIGFNAWPKFAEGRVKPIEIELINNDIASVLRGLPRSRYFVYLSNAYSIGPIDISFAEQYESRVEFKAIRANPNILDGSVFMISMPSARGVTLLLRKTQGKLRLHYYVSEYQERAESDREEVYWALRYINQG